MIVNSFCVIDDDELFFCYDIASSSVPVHSSPWPCSLPSNEERPRLDFSDTFSQTFTRQLLLLLLLPLPPPPPSRLTQQIYLVTVAIVSKYFHV